METDNKIIDEIHRELWTNSLRLHRAVLENTLESVTIFGSKWAHICTFFEYNQEKPDINLQSIHMWCNLCAMPQRKGYTYEITAPYFFKIKAITRTEYENNVFEDGVFNMLGEPSNANHYGKEFEFQTGLYHGKLTLVLYNKLWKPSPHGWFVRHEKPCTFMIALNHARYVGPLVAPIPKELDFVDMCKKVKRRLLNKIKLWIDF